MIHVSAPGKLFVSGEWSILEPGNSAIVAAVNRRVHAEIEALTGGYISIYADDFKIRDVRLRFDGSVKYITNADTQTKEKIKFVVAAMEIALQYIKKKAGTTKTFKIHTWGEDLNINVDGEQKKVGFGSSAAAVVATIASILEFHGFSISKNKEEIYKLAAIAHYNAQGKIGSGFDIAASAYGGIFHYVAPDTKLVIDAINKNEKNVEEVVESKWPLLHIEPLPEIASLRFGVCWTKSSADTVDMVKSMREWRLLHSEDYNAIIKEIGVLAESIVVEWKSRNKDNIIKMLRKNEDLLRKLGNISGLPIETPDLKKLSDIANNFGAAGKLSGAGGGDCGIAICFSEDVIEKIKSEWQYNGLTPLDTTIDYKGVSLEHYSKTIKC